MPVWRLQCAFGADSPQPRDRIVITPHFDDSGVTTDPQGLCDDLAAALNTWSNNSRQVEVTAYDAQGTPPVFPQGTAIVNAGAFPESSCPRELALCLSYFSENNVPRRRGRLYASPAVLGMGTQAVRPIQASMEKIGDLAAILQELGGADVDWVVYSRVDDQARPVTDWWVDNEWDVMRSRGLLSTARHTGTTSEG